MRRQKCNGEKRGGGRASIYFHAVIENTVRKGGSEPGEVGIERKRGFPPCQLLSL